MSIFHNDEPIDQNWVQSWTDKGAYVNHIPGMQSDGTCFFLYYSRSGPHEGWALFREEIDGDETFIEKVRIKGQLRLLLAGLGIGPNYLEGQTEADFHRNGRMP